MCPPPLPWTQGGRLVHTGILMAASKDTPWYLLWAYVSAIFMATVSASFFLYDGDVSHQRLAAKGFDEAPQSSECHLRDQTLAAAIRQ